MTILNISYTQIWALNKSIQFLWRIFLAKGYTRLNPYEEL